MSNHIEPRAVFVVVPAFNEQQTLSLVVDGLLERKYSVVVVDDGSEKNLQHLLQKRRVFFLRHRINLGQGAALQTGIEFSLSKGAAYIVTFDADGQHDPDDIGQLLQPLVTSQADIVLASRFMSSTTGTIPFTRKLVLRTARFINYFFTGLLLTDAHNGLRAMTAKAARLMQLEENRMAHASEILLKIRKEKLRYVEVPARVHYTDYSRAKGQSGWNGFRIVFDLLLNKIFR